jgi:hypothetical protein
VKAEFRIGECGLGIEFEERVFDGGTKHKSAIRRADWGLNLKKGFLAGN